MSTTSQPVPGSQSNRAGAHHDEIVRELYEITSHARYSIPDKIRLMLAFGCARLGLDIGIFSKINGNTYTVIHTVNPEHVGLSPGDEFNLDETYCSITVNAGDLFTIEHCAESIYATHPAYEKFQLESYVGIPIIVDDGLYGTLNFSSHSPHLPFSSYAQDAVIMLATWLGMEIKRYWKEAELKRAYNELAEAEQVFRLAIDASPVAMFIVNLEGSIKLTNRQSEMLFGYNATELIDQPIETLVPQEFRQVHPKYRARYLDAPITRPMGAGRDLMGRKRNGECFPVEIGLNPITRDDGTYILCSVIDLTERERQRQQILDQSEALEAANRELTEAEKMLRLAIDASPVAMLIANQDGLIKLANQQSELLFGYEITELVGQPIEILVPEQLRVNHPRYRSEYLKTPTSRPMGLGRDLMGRKRNGECFPVEIGLNPIVKDGVTQILCSVIDLTERERQRQQILDQSAELEVANRLLNEQVRTDVLTGVRNRKAFLEAMERCLATAQRSGLPVSVAMIDIDHFKAYNDQFGHPAGDVALQAVADVLIMESRRMDTVARYGGEEFIILLPEADEHESMASAERIRQAIRLINSLERCVSVSIGVATTRVPVSRSIDDERFISNLVNNADQALYHAKNSGRDRVMHFDNLRMAAPIEEMEEC